MVTAGVILFSSAFCGQKKVSDTIKNWIPWGPTWKPLSQFIKKQANERLSTMQNAYEAGVRAGVKAGVKLVGTGRVLVEELEEKEEASPSSQVSLPQIEYIQEEKVESIPQKFVEALALLDQQITQLHLERGEVLSTPLEEKVFVEFVKRALSQRPDLLAKAEEDDWNAIYQITRKMHAVFFSYLRKTTPVLLKDLFPIHGAILLVIDIACRDDKVTDMFKFDNVLKSIATKRQPIERETLVLGVSISHLVISVRKPMNMLRELIRERISSSSSSVDPLDAFTTTMIITAPAVQFSPKAILISDPIINAISRAFVIWFAGEAFRIDRVVKYVRLGFYTFVRYHGYIYKSGSGIKGTSLDRWNLLSDQIRSTKGAKEIVSEKEWEEYTDRVQENSDILDHSELARNLVIGPISTQILDIVLFSAIVMVHFEADKTSKKTKAMFEKFHEDAMKKR